MLSDGLVEILRHFAAELGANMSKHSPKKHSNEFDAPAGEDRSEVSIEPDATNDLPAVVTAPFAVEGAQGLSVSELDETLKVLRAELRRRENEREASRPRVRSKVRILKGRPKYVGQIGTAVIVRRSRCFVAVPDISSPAYAIISDLELLER